MVWIAASACALCVVVLVLAEVAERRLARATTKLVASGLFLVTAWLAGVPWFHPALFVGLGLGAVGDALLLSTEKRWFLAGLVAFLANHLAYLIGFGLDGLDAPIVAMTSVPLVAFAIAVWRWLRPHAGSMTGPVLAYIVVITAMVAGAAGTGRWLWIVGALLFFVSDLAVARQRFVIQSPTNRIVGLPLYYAGQLAFALTGVLG